MLDEQLITELRAQVEATGLTYWDVEEAEDVVRLCASCCLVAAGT
jgi:hypothetical protein